MCVVVGLVHMNLCLVLRICLCSVVGTCKSLRLPVCICRVGTYESMFSCKNMSLFYERVCFGRYVCVSLFGWYICVYV